MTLDQLLDLILRWAHLIAGIMWIGNSMLFNWLDRNLVKTPDAGRLSQGTIWMVHSGAFYEVEKKLLEPKQMPAQMHWFKWQNFATWATGISLLVVVYFMNDAALLADPTVLEPAAAIAVSLGSLVVGWAIYDLLWRFVGEKQPPLAAGLSLALLVGAIYGYEQVFTARASYLMVGVLVGTVMTGNVWMRILPSQRDLIAATRAGREQDATLSIRAKQRSIHNNYMTFPLLFIMLSSHFEQAYLHHLNWVILIVVMFGGATVRHFMNVRYHGKPWLAPALAAGALTVAGIVLLTGVEKDPVKQAERAVPFSRVQEIMGARCVSCHSVKPTDQLAAVVPRGVHFDTPEQIVQFKDGIERRAVLLKDMPYQNNKTGMTEEERGELARWLADGAKIQ